jgi:tRNA pseudouridine55 synthase
MPGPSGLLNLDKPAGITSHQAVQKVRRILKSRRVGHGGTLDPAATGVLPILLRDATRLMEFLADAKKHYVATVHLGIVTDTLDADGRILEQNELPRDLNRSRTETTLSEFQGEILQTVPSFSAVRQDGRRMYELARKGQPVDAPTRTVHIHQLQLSAFAPPELIVDVTCGKGTYIRQLAADLGERLGCGAHLKALRRTRVGPLNVEEAVSLEDLTRAAEQGTLETHILPMTTAAWNLPTARVDNQTAKKLGNGQRIPVEDLGLAPDALDPNGPSGQLVAVSVGDHDLVAVVRINGERAQPVKVFPSQIR